MSPLWNDEQERPLQHLRVLDLSILYPGPYLTRILAQYGAEVFKIENLPDGDPLRHLGQTGMFEWLNQGKQSIGVQLKTEKGAELVRQMAGEADVFVETYREGVLDSLGLGYAEVSRLNPELLYVSLRGYGGKNAVKAGHDLCFVASSGCGEWFLEAGPNYSTQWADLVGGTMVPAIKILSHLSNPDRRGMQLVNYIDTSFRSLFVGRAYDTVKSGTLPGGLSGIHRFADGTRPHSRYYRCRDAQWVALDAVQDKHWRRFCEIVGQPGWITRAADSNLIPELDRLFASQPGDYWRTLFQPHDACAVKVTTWNEHLMELPSRDQVLSDPLAWAGFAPSTGLTPAPSFGRDTFPVLHAMGISNKEYSDLVAAGVLAQSAKGAQGVPGGA